MGGGVDPLKQVKERLQELLALPTPTATEKAEIKTLSDQVTGGGKRRAGDPVNTAAKRFKFSDYNFNSFKADVKDWMETHGQVMMGEEISDDVCNIIDESVERTKRIRWYRGSQQICEIWSDSIPSLLR